jgi:hypothetical protein
VATAIICQGILCSAQAPNPPSASGANGTSIVQAILQGERRNLQFGPFKSYKWRVLEVQGDRALVITEKVIGFGAYHNARGEAVKWKDCDLRKFLNGPFLEKFSAEDQRLVLETKVVNPKNSPLPEDGGDDTMDKVFLLNVKEARRYFAKATDRKIGSWWWLRDQGGNSHSASNVYHDGPMSRRGYYAHYEYCGIRPALWLSLRP